MSKPKDRAIKTPKRKGKWVEGNVQEFLSLSDADMELIETRLPLVVCLKAHAKRRS
jgi:hypothetical protein